MLTCGSRILQIKTICTQNLNIFVWVMCQTPKMNSRIYSIFQLLDKLYRFLVHFQWYLYENYWEQWWTKLLINVETPSHMCSFPANVYSTIFTFDMYNNNIAVSYATPCVIQMKRNKFFFWQLKYVCKENTRCSKHTLFSTAVIH